MKVFTYNDYIKTIHTLRLNEVFRIAEEGAMYNLKENNTKEKGNTITKKDSLIEKLVENKDEMANFINTHLNLSKKILGSDLEKYENSQILKKFKSKPPKVIYKQEGSETFYIVEYLQKLDDTMSYRLLNFCIEIIYEWSKTARFKNKTKYPRVIPIVIYTGKEKWKSCKTNKKKISTQILKNYEINFEYNLIEFT